MIRVQDIKSVGLKYCIRIYFSPGDSLAADFALVVEH